MIAMRSADEPTPMPASPFPGSATEPLPVRPSSEGKLTAGVLALLLVLGCCPSFAEPASGQQVFRPSSVWGEVPVEHEGLVVGSVEVLAAMLIGLFTSWLLVAWLLFEKWRWLASAGRLAGSEAGRVLALAESRRKLLAWITYGVVPGMGIVAILISGHRTLFGLEVALIANVLSLMGIFTGLSAFLVSSTLRHRIEPKAD